VIDGAIEGVCVGAGVGNLEGVFVGTAPVKIASCSTGRLIFFDPASERIMLELVQVRPLTDAATKESTEVQIN